MILIQLLPINLLCIISTFFTLGTAIQSRPEDEFYYAAVIEYSPLAGSDGNDTLAKNANEYVKLIGKAAASADIVVFPELGLNYEDISIYIDIPFGNDSIAPVDNSSLHPVLRQLSKAARDNQVYVSFTIHEKDCTSKEELRYNTNVVFDRKGQIVARYRKYNYFNEPYLNVTKSPEVVYFDSDFGVRFGMFICFDIFFKEPALTLVYERNITDIIFPSWWFSELPSLLSVQMQFAWAYMTDTNLLAAGINSVQRSSTGSGIYAGKNGPLVYVFSGQNQTQILTAKLSKIDKGKSEGQKHETTNVLESGLHLWNEDLQFYKTHLLTDIPNNEDTSNKPSLVLTETLNKTLCQNNLCCDFMINMTLTYLPLSSLNFSDMSYAKNDSFYHYQYRLAVFDGVRGFYGATSAGIQVCAIIPCLNDSLSSCGKQSGNTLPLIVDSPSHGKIYLNSTSFNSITIKATSKVQTDFTFPDVLESSKSSSQKEFGSLPKVSQINFNTNNLSSNLKLMSDNLIYAGIYSRIVSRDGQKPTSSGNKLYFMPLSLLLIICVSFVLSRRY